MKTNLQKYWYGTRWWRVQKWIYSYQFIENSMGNNPNLNSLLKLTHKMREDKKEKKHETQMKRNQKYYTSQISDMVFFFPQWRDLTKPHQAGASSLFTRSNRDAFKPNNIEIWEGNSPILKSSEWVNKQTGRKRKKNNNPQTQIHPHS